jgi:FtsP/CotA-like multicopper oxidase with cupredoxin domain
MPAEMHTVDMTADNPGTWMFHCHVEGHLASGMYTHYVVEPREISGPKATDILSHSKH